MHIYNEEHLIFQDSVRRFAAKHLLPQIDQWEKDCHFPNEVFEKLGSEGFLGMLIEERWGGVGGDYIMAGAWCEEFGRIPALGLTTGVNMHALVIAPTLQRFGSEEAKEMLLPDAVLGKKIGAYAFTEPGAGSDLTVVRSVAHKDGSSYILNGAKTFITNGARADFVLVLAKTDPDKVITVLALL